MNRVTREVVELAFRVVDFDRAVAAAQNAANPTPPAPVPLADGLRAMAGVQDPPGVRTPAEELLPEQLSTRIRARVTLQWFVRSGCP